MFAHIFEIQVSHDFIYAFHMPLFFMAAGWLYRIKPVLSYTKHRFFTVMVPYFSFGFFTLLYWLLIERHFRTSDMTFLQSLIGLIRGEYDFLDFNVHLWFLPCFFLTVVIYNGLRNVMGRRGTYIIALVLSAVYVVGAYGTALPSLPWGLNRVCQYIGFYAVGNWMSETKINEKVERKPVWAAIATMLLVLVFVLSLFDLTTGFILTSGIFWFITGTMGTVAVGIYSILLSGLSGLGAAIINNLISFLGRISLVVLCVHGPVYRVVSKVLSVVIGVVTHVEMDTDAVRGNFFFALVIVVITLAICSVAYMVIDGILPWMIGKPRRSREPVTSRIAATVSAATKPAVTDLAATKPAVIVGRISE